MGLTNWLLQSLLSQEWAQETVHSTGGFNRAFHMTTRQWDDGTVNS